MHQKNTVSSSAKEVSDSECPWLAVLRRENLKYPHSVIISQERCDGTFTVSCCDSSDLLTKGIRYKIHISCFVSQVSIFLFTVNTKVMVKLKPSSQLHRIYNQVTQPNHLSHQAASPSEPVHSISLPSPPTPSSSSSPPRIPLA